MSPEIPLKAIDHIRRMGRGSESHLMLCENGALCVVKLRRKTGHSELMSAFVASRIAKSFGLPTPECVVVEICDSLLHGVPELAKVRELCSEDWPNLHPGTYYVGSQDRPLLDLLPDSYLRCLDNRNTFLHAFALDKWCSHLGPPRPVFYRSGSSSQYSAEFVGRGGCFGGPRSGFRDDPRNGIYCQKTVYSHVMGWDSLDPFLSNLILASPDDLYRATQDLPFGWSNEHSGDLNELVESLLQRRSRIRQLIAQTRDEVPDLFPNWTRRTFVPAQQGLDASPLLRLIRNGLR
jgi:hypothetical protein